MVVHVGIIPLMPIYEQYKDSLENILPKDIKISYIKLNSKTYKSTDKSLVASWSCHDFKETFDHIIITGAPIETKRNDCFLNDENP